jgi:hypothetical protein
MRTGIAGWRWLAAFVENHPPTAALSGGEIITIFSFDVGVRICYNTALVD